MTNYDGTDDFEGVVTADQLNKTAVWKGTALPVLSANKIPQNGLFLLVDSLSNPTTSDFYVQTSATLSVPVFVQVIRSDPFSGTAVVFKSAIDRYLGGVSHASSTSPLYTATSTKTQISRLSDAAESGSPGNGSLNNTYTRAGFKVKSPMNGLVINKYTWEIGGSAPLGVEGSPVGAIHAVVRDSSDVIKSDILQGQAADFPNSAAQLNTMYVDDVTLATSDRVLIESDLLDASNYLTWWIDSPTNTSYEYTYYNGSTWTDSGAGDV